MQELGINTALRRRAWVVFSAAVLMFAALPAVAAAKKHKKHKPQPVGAVYAETNGTANQLLVFDRYADGHLKLRQTVNAGGAGGHQAEPGCMPPTGCPLIDAQGEVKLSGDGKWVFAVNAGSNTIASFSAGKHVKLVGTVPSNGVFPNSITIHGNVLYVLNTNSMSIAGFKIASNGKLSSIAGSKQSLTPEHAPLSRQIGFDNTGKVLVVSELTDATFDTFQVSSSGVAGPATAHASASPEPFAFSFDPVYNHLVDTEVVNDQDFTQSSNSSSYSVSASGAVTKISTIPTKGYAACWTQITSDGKWVFAVNTGGPSPFGATVTSFSLAANGQLTFKSVTTKDGEFTLTDEGLTPDNKYLYVVAPLINNPFTMPPPATNGSKIVTFKVGAAGKLTRIGQTTNKIAPGVSGIAVG